MNRRSHDAGGGGDIRKQAVGGIELNTSSKITPPSSSDSVPRTEQGRLPFEADEDYRRLLDEHIKSLSETMVKRLKLEEERIEYQRESDISINGRF